MKPTNEILSPRWLSNLKRRIGKCIIFGLQPSQIIQAGRILRTVAKDWKELVAGSEGYLVGRGRAGLERHKVSWGEMVGPCFLLTMAQIAASYYKVDELIRKPRT